MSCLLINDDEMRGCDLLKSMTGPLLLGLGLYSQGPTVSTPIPLYTCLEVSFGFNCLEGGDEKHSKIERMKGEKSSMQIFGRE